MVIEDCARKSHVVRKTPGSKVKASGRCFAVFVYISFSCLTIVRNMSTLVQLAWDYFTLRDVLIFSAVSLATWLFYKVGVEPFLSPIRKVTASHGTQRYHSECKCECSVNTADYVG